MKWRGWLSLLLNFTFIVSFWPLFMSCTLCWALGARHTNDTPSICLTSLAVKHPQKALSVSLFRLIFLITQSELFMRLEEWASETKIKISIYIQYTFQYTSELPDPSNTRLWWISSDREWDSGVEEEKRILLISLIAAEFFDLTEPQGKPKQSDGVHKRKY